VCLSFETPHYRASRSALPNVSASSSTVQRLLLSPFHRAPPHTNNSGSPTSGKMAVRKTWCAAALDPTGRSGNVTAPCHAPRADPVASSGVHKRTGTGGQGSRASRATEYPTGWPRRLAGGARDGEDARPRLEPQGIRERGSPPRAYPLIPLRRPRLLLLLLLLLR
jgi:hypothetical protein